MANCDCEVALVSGPLGLTSQETALGAGAIVEFFGNVRPLENGKRIDGIEYEAHRQMAEHQLRKIAQEAAERFDLLMIKLHHCVGFVAVSETSLFLRVAAAHRGAAFEASRWTIDELKKRVPIWKSVRFRVGSAEEKERPAPVLA
jgi:molybdopterin synthase catalytic subunit